MKAIIVALVLLWASVAGASGLVLGTACTGSPCGNSHCLLNINAEPFAGGTFVDTSAYARVVTNINVTQSAAQVKFGTQSWENDINTDKLTVPDSPNWAIAGDFSIGMWVYIPVLATASAIIGQYSGAGDRAWRGAVTAAGAVQLWAFDAGDAQFITLTSANGVLAAAGWHYLEGTRRGSDAYLFVDGLLVATDATAGGAVQNCTDPVGTSDGTVGFGPVGYFDSWVITSGGWAWNRSHTVPGRRW